MSDQNFDKHIKNSLENLEDSFDSGSWEALQQRMDATSVPQTDSPLPTTGARGVLKETQLASMLQQVEPMYQSGHWDLLAKRLDHIARMRRVRVHKCAEAVLVILLLANLQSFLQGGAKLFNMPVPATPAETPAAPHMAQHRNGHSNNGTLATSLVVPSFTETGDSAMLRLFATQLVPMSNDETLMVQNIIPFDPSRLQADQSNGMATALVGPDGLLIPRGLSPLSLLAALGLDVFDPRLAAPSLALGITIPTQKAGHSGKQQYIKLFAGYDLNRTNIDNQSFASKNTGGQAGIMYGIRKGKWGVEAGVAYSSKTYQTGKEIIRFAQDPAQGYVGTSLDQVEGRLIAVPVRATRQVAKAGKTRAVLTAGGTAHMAATKSYRFKNYSYPQPPTTSGDPVDLPKAQAALQGGKARENFYATADLGLRIEHPINRRLTAFVEPVYSRTVGGNGFSPKNAQTHTTSVQAGVLAIL